MFEQDISKINQMNSKENPLVIIIILNWNGWVDTIECLDSIFKNSYPNYLCIIVDNGSTDNSISNIVDYYLSKDIFSSNKIENICIKIFKKKEIDIEKEYNLSEILKLPSNKKLIILDLGSNLGFSAGNNFGIYFAMSHFNTPYFFLLNNDTVINVDTISKMMHTIINHPNAGIVGPSIYFYHSSEKKNIWFNGGVINFLKYPGYSNSIFTPQLTNKGRDLVNKTDYVSGCALLIKKVDNIKLKLNEKYFFGCEDVELSLQYQKKGYDLLINHNASVWHKVSSSRNKMFDNNLLKVTLSAIKVNFAFLRNNNKFFWVMLPVYCYQACKIHQLHRFKFKDYYSIIKG